MRASCGRYAYRQTRNRFSADYNISQRKSGTRSFKKKPRKIQVLSQLIRTEETYLQYGIQSFDAGDGFDERKDRFQVLKGCDR